MGISSARPDNLDRFARKSRQLDHTLVTTLRRILRDYHAFQEANHWGVFEADSLLGAFSRYTNGNEFTAKWVANIAARFRAAGGGGHLVRLPDSAIKASLKAAGLDHGRHHVTFDKPVAYGSPPTTGYTDDPINTATGNFVEVEGDLLCGGLVAGLTFERTYNSRSDRVGPFGRGWSSWASVALVPGPEGAAYIGPDGQEAVFPRQGDGYGRIVGVAALVEPLESGLALGWLGSAERWVFDEAGRVVSLSRGPGTEVRLERDAGGRLVGMSHAGGRHVRLEWDEDAQRIVAVACSDGRSTVYRYDASGNLVEAQGAAGARRYEVDGSGRVASVIDADGVVELVNTYDEEGRVVEQLSPFGRTTRIFYLPGGVTVTMDDDEDHPANTFVHDIEGRLTAVVDGDEQQLSTIYDEWGNPTAVTERNGVVTLQEHDERNRPVRRVLPSGAGFTFAWDDADRLVEVAASNGAVTRCVFDGEERSPSEIVDAEGGVTRQTVRDGLVHRIVDPDGVTVDLDYDADGELVATTDGDGNIARLERDEAGRVIAMVSPLGRRTALFYDAKGRLVERHEPHGGAWRFERTTAGRLTSVTDPLGAREEIRYGEHGHATATIDPLGRVTATEYDVFGNVVGVVEPGDAAWRYEYDALMRATATIDPSGARWQREYDVNGTLVATVDPAGVRVSARLDGLGRVIGIDDGATSTTIELDELGRVVARSGPDGTIARAQYDLAGRCTLIEDGTGAITRLEYTPAGRLARRVAASGRVDLFEHDACGRRSARVDGAGRRWEYRYDADGELSEIQLPTGEVERLEYDDGGRLAGLSSPGAGTTTCRYDAAGRIVSVIDRESGERRFAYDAAGNIIEAVDGNGGRTTYAHDERGRLSEVVDPLGAVTRGRYDEAGRITELADPLGRTTTLAYDPAGRLVEQVDGSGRAVRRSYDAAGRVCAVGPAGATPTAIEYDPLGRITAIAEPGAPANTLSWDAAGRLVERRRGDLAMRWTYDADGERVAIGYPDGSETTYEHDAGGFVVAARHPTLGTIELQRDTAGRLIGARAEGMQALWRYEDGDLVQYEMKTAGTLRTAQLMRDPIGRVVEATIDGAAHEFTYDGGGQLVAADTSAGAYTFGYDANGRLARESSPAGDVQFSYDAAGQLAARATAADDVTRYEYDGGGRRIREAAAGLDRTYRWDEVGRLTEVADRGDGDGDAPRTIGIVVDALGELASVDGTPMLWDTAHPLQPLAWSGQDAVVGEGSPWALANAGAAHWLAPDWQGTIGQTPRDPWGAALARGGAADGAGVQFGFRGEVEFGADTWLRNRVYQPASRAFLQRDDLPPVAGSAVYANPYHYAANNAVGLSDPLGLHPVSEKELNSIRDRMDRGLLDDLADIGKFIYKNAGTAALIVGTAAFMATGVGAVVLGAGAVVLTLAAGYQSFQKSDWPGVVLDVVGLFPGVGAVVKGFKAVNAVRASGKAVKSATGAAHDAAAAAAIRPNHFNFDSVRSAYHTGVAGQKDRLAGALEGQAHNLDVFGLKVGVVSAVRTHGPSVGLPIPDFLRPPAAEKVGHRAGTGP